MSEVARELGVNGPHDLASGASCGGTPPRGVSARS